MFSSPEFWVGIAFIIFLIGIGKRAFSFLTQSLAEHSLKISQRLEEAQRLHDEALSLLNSYKDKHKNALEQASHIMAFAEEEVLELKKSNEQAFEKFVASKEKALFERISLAREETKTKLQHQATDAAFQIVERFLSKEPEEKKTLTEASLKKVESLSLSP